MKTTFWGYRRENGRVGIRNHVIILPLDDLSNAACQAVENNIKGTLALPHHYGRLQFGEDLELHFRTLIGVGCNPNVAAVIVIGIEPLWTQRIVDGIAKTGKPVAGFSIEKNGDLNTIAAASRKAKEFLQQVTDYQRVECDVKELWVSCKCGESDTTSGIAANPTVGNAFDKLWEAGATTLFGETTEITGGDGKPVPLRSSARPRKLPVASTLLQPAASTTKCATSSCTSLIATQRLSTITRPMTCAIPSRPRAISKAV